MNLLGVPAGLTGDQLLDEQGDEEVAEAVIAASRKNYAKKYIAKKKPQNTRIPKEDNKKKRQGDRGRGQDHGNSILMTDSEGTMG